MSTINILQVSLEIWGCIICVVLAHLSGSKAYRTGGVLKRVWVLIIIDGLFLASDAFAYLFRGDRSNFGIIMTRVSNYTMFFTEAVLAWNYALLVMEFIGKKGREIYKNIWVKISGICILMMLLGLLITTKTGLYFSFDQYNCYQRGKGIFISFGLLAIVYIGMSIKILFEREKLTPNVWNAVRLAMIVIVLSFILQFLKYGISFINISITIVLIVLFGCVWYDQSIKENESKIEELEEIIKELLEKRE